MPIPIGAVLGIAAVAAMFALKKKPAGEVVITKRDDEGNIISTTERADDGTVVTRDADGNIETISTVTDEGKVETRDTRGNIVEPSEEAAQTTIQVRDLSASDIKTDISYDKTLSKEDQARILNAWRTAVLAQDPQMLLAIKEDYRRLAGPAAAQDLQELADAWIATKTPVGTVTKTASGVTIDTVNEAVKQQAAVEEVKEEAKATGMILPEPAATAPTLGDATQARKVLASKVALMIQVSTKGKENQNLVREFEVQEGITPSGKYGVNVGLALIRYNICPTKPPFYWGRVGDYASIAREKQQYKSALLAKAMNDNSRTSEWRNAANAVK